MAPASATCWACDVPFKAGQRLYTCGGVCGNFIHQSCNSEDTQWQLLFCPECTGTKEKKTMTNAELNTKLTAMFAVVKETQLQLLSLTTEIKFLREENRALRDELNHNNEGNERSHKHTQPTGKNFDKTYHQKQFSQNSNVSHQAAANYRTSRGARSNSNGLRFGSLNNRGGPEHAPQQPQPGEAPAAPSTGSRTGGRNNQQQQLRRGTGEAADSTNTGSFSAGKRTKTKKVFVTNVKKSITANNIIEKIKSWGAKVHCVQRLRSRNTNCASFCIQVPPESFNTIMDPTKWEENIGFKEFIGFPLPHQVEDTVYAENC